MIQEKIYSYFNNNPPLHILFIFDTGGDFCYELEKEEWPTNDVYHDERNVLKDRSILIHNNRLWHYQ
mgnify:CR=1 FL=1